MWRERNWQTSGGKIASEMARFSVRFCFRIPKIMEQNERKRIEVSLVYVVIT